MSLFIVISLFITSFFPLWISIIFIDVKSIIYNGSNLYTEIISIIAIVIVNFFSIIALCNWIKREPITSEEMKISYACENKTISSEYLLAYILPLFAFDFTQWDSVVLFLIFSKPIFLQFSINSDFTETSSYIPVCIRLHFPVYNPSCKSDTCSLRGLKTWNRTHPMTYGSYIRKISPQQEISYACQK